MRRVVVTGMGIVSSIGNNTQEVLASLREAKSGISLAEDFVKYNFRCQVQGDPKLDPHGMVTWHIDLAGHGRLVRKLVFEFSTAPDVQGL